MVDLVEKRLEQRALQSFIARSVLVIICLTTAAIELFDRSFVRIRLGPLFISDAAWLLCICLIYVSQVQMGLRDQVRILWAPLLFFFTGLIRLIIEIASYEGKISQQLLFRIAQHSLVFIYPLAWSTMGAWMATLNRRWSDQWLLVVLFAGLIVSLFQVLHLGVIPIGGNLAVGPLVLVAALWWLNEGLQQSIKPGDRFWLIGCAILALLAGFAPIWESWGIYMQRTTFLLSVLTISIVPWLVLRKNESRFIGLALIMGTWMILVFGIVLADMRLASLKAHTSLLGEMTAVITKRNQVDQTIHNSLTKLEPHPNARLIPNTALKDDFLNSFQHGEDRPTTEGGRTFQFRVRGHMWHNALDDWQNAPIFGVGFIQEVPSVILPGLPNTGGFEFPTAPPISGPHNSYLSILARMGIAGMIVFILFVGRMFIGAIRVMRDSPKSLESILLLFLLFNGAVHALFNVGFESPHRSIIMWIAAGILMAYTTKTLSERSEERN
jgi:hypothetical protein